MADFSEDLISKLPAASATKLRALLEARAVCYGALKFAMDAVEEVRQRLERAEMEAHRRIEALPPTRPEGAVEQFLASVVKIKAEYQRAVEAERRASEAWGRFSYLEALRDWAQMYLGRDGKLAHQPLPPVKLAKSENYRQAVDRLRRDIEAVEAAWAETEAAPMPPAAIKADLTASIDRIAERGALSISSRNRDGDPARIEQAIRLDIVGGNKIGDGGSSVLIWLCRDMLVDRLHSMVDAMSINGAISDAERDARFSELADKRLALEFEEEAVICAAAAEGMTIDRRIDADPRGLLEVVEVFDDAE